MSEHAGFLRDIVEHPNDDAPRLIYADWLDEQGDHARAAFIRAQCHLALFSQDEDEPFSFPADRLLPEHRAAFLAPLLALGLPEGTSRYRAGEESGVLFYCRRGFVEAVEVFGSRTARMFVQRAEQLFDLTPLRHLRFGCQGLGPDAGRDFHLPALDAIPLSTLEAVAASPWLARLDTLNLSGQYLRDEAARLFLRLARQGPRTGLLLTNNQFSPGVRRALHERFGDAVSLGGVLNWPDDEVPF